jgi:phosphate-selective porin
MSIKKLNQLGFILSLAFLLPAGKLNAQEQQSLLKTDSTLNVVKKELAWLKKLKISGYVQGQWQYAEEKGIKSFAGGDFASGVNNRFTIRRGRVKFAYENKFALAVMQFDITEKGVGIKDAYLGITEPWIKAVGLTVGVFDRPFGYEISYSSSSRETPERSRLFQTLFPGERDLGAKLTLKAPKGSVLDFLALDAGVFNGNGIAIETDSYKDFIGHLYANNLSKKDKDFRWGVGASYYNGGFASGEDGFYEMKKVDGKSVFVLNGDLKKGERVKREYIGFDAQLSYNWNDLVKTQLRGEYLFGTQPGVEGSTKSPTAAVAGNVYSRNFRGYYVYFIQDIPRTRLQLVVKYDNYDPNTTVAGNNIGLASTAGNTSGFADLSYSTWGFGLNYKIYENILVMAYFDLVKNETSDLLADFNKDIKDNVFTLRLQYKF